MHFHFGSLTDFFCKNLRFSGGFVQCGPFFKASIRKIPLPSSPAVKRTFLSVRTSTIIKPHFCRMVEVRDMGEMRALIFLFVLQTEFRLGNLLLQLGLEKVFVWQFRVVLGDLDACIAQLKELDLFVIAGGA